jgi:hypothetical protein
MFKKLTSLKNQITRKDETINQISNEQMMSILEDAAAEAGYTL